MGKWFLVFLLTPMAELAILIEVGGQIGAWPTVCLVAFTAVVGVVLLKRQGIATLTRALARVNAGELPAFEVVEGLLLAVAGALLVTPGFITDTVGFGLLTPALRTPLTARLVGRIASRVADREGRTFESGPD